MLDVGAWFRGDRQLQDVADAAALAAAQELPQETGAAAARRSPTRARTAGRSRPATSSSRTTVDNDTVAVDVSNEADGLLQAPWYRDGYGYAKAKARASTWARRRRRPHRRRYQAPLALVRPEPCFDQATTLDLTKTGQGRVPTPQPRRHAWRHRPNDLADWIPEQLQRLPPARLVLPGCRRQVQRERGHRGAGRAHRRRASLPRLRRGDRQRLELRVPRRRQVGFVMTAFDAQGSGGTIDGHFTKVTWDGLETTDPPAVFRRSHDHPCRIATGTKAWCNDVQDQKISGWPLPSRSSLSSWSRSTSPSYKENVQAEEETVKVWVASQNIPRDDRRKGCRNRSARLRT